MSQTIRVFHLIKSLGRGGAEMLLPESLRFADRDRFTYGYGYFLPWKDAIVPNLSEQGAEVVCFPARNNAQILLSVKKVADHLHRWGADVIHCHLPIAGVVGRMVGRLTGIPVVYTEHGPMEYYHPLTRRLHLLTWNWQRGVVAVSADAAASIRRHTRSHIPLRVVLNGVDTDHFQWDAQAARQVRKQYGIPEEAPVIGTIAVFRAQKALHHWIAAARRLKDRHPDVRFLIVGDGPLREQLRAETSACSLEGDLYFTGLQKEVRPYLSAMDLYMMSSDFEGLPVALLEAMSMRCAILSTAVGGVPEVIRDRSNGFLVSPGNPEALADAASEMLINRELLEQMRSSARSSVQERFSMRRMAAELEAMYCEVLAGANGGH